MRVQGELDQSINVAFVVVCFFVTLLGMHAFGVLLQYVSKRFHLFIAEVCILSGSTSNAIFICRGPMLSILFV